MFKGYNKMAPEKLNHNKLQNHNSFERYPLYSVFSGTETLSYLGPKIWDLVPNERKQLD